MKHLILWLFLLASGLADAAITFRSKDSAYDAAVVSAGTLTITAPSGIVNDDLLVAYLRIDNLGDETVEPFCSPPGGWTLYTNTLTQTETGGRGSASAIFTKKAASEAGNYAFTNDLVTTEEMGGSIVVYSGVDTTTALDVTPSASHYSFNIDDTTPTPPAIVTVNNNTMVLIFAGSTDPTSITDHAVPTGYTERVDVIGNARANHAIAEKLIPTATTETPGSYTLTGAGAGVESHGTTIALRPAAAGNNPLRRRRN